MRVREWVDRGFWALICGAALYLSGQITKLTDSVNELNVRFAVYITRQDGQGQDIVDLKDRMRRMEERRR